MNGLTNTVFATGRQIGRRLMLSALWISLLITLGTHAAFAHADHTESTLQDLASQGLVVDADLCGTDAYRIEGTDLCTHGQDTPPTIEQVQAIHASLAATASTPIVCDGDGVSGKRVQVMYVHTAEKTDQYADVVAQIRTAAAGVDAIYEASAQETGGNRHVRFVTDANCQVDVTDVELPTGADATFVATVSALAGLGYTNPERKYLLFVDADVYCGIGTAKRDSQPGLANASNQKVGYARVDRICWSAMTAAHELTHTLGGVQNDAPHTTGGYHCTDEHDIMCYADSPSAPAMTIVCTDEGHEYLLDCNHDDYFNTNPTPDNYLYTHWNVANSQFLFDAPPATPVSNDVTGQQEEETSSGPSNIAVQSIYLPIVVK